MRHFLFPDRPLSRRVITTLHGLLQLAILGYGGYWLWLGGLHQELLRWGTGVGAMLCAMIVLRLMAELWLLPHYLKAQVIAMSGRAPMITRPNDPRTGRPPNTHGTHEDDGVGEARPSKRKKSAP
ncbi:hypothetical protein [Larsenimonas salina]|uniref:hypothetical protein n=1 Tax=Larsenimonas salina TaxID=1295565 RepID=UPI002073299B|nr:hypothetical protein [Larsenimonas salina]MCM5704475.1 hypothetical protein [Larsenimonas salina]